MQRKLNNPYDPDVSRCFGCSSNNPIGLKMEFKEQDEYVMADWEPKEHYQGYVNVLHGGIIATMLDEVSAWCVNVKIGTAGVTSELKVRYLKPVFLSSGNITVRARIVSRDGRYIKLKSDLQDGKGKICASAESLFFAYPEEMAKKKFGFPGKDKF